MAESEGVRNFHLNSDVDSSKFAQHHTIGTKYGQAAPGEGYASLVKRVEELEKPWYNHYMVAMYASGDSNAANGSWSTIGGYNTPFDGFASTTVRNAELGNPVEYSLGIINPSVDVWIDVMFYVELANNSTGRRGIRISMDGVDTNSEIVGNFQSALSASPMRLETSYHGPVASDHDLRLQVYQDSGAALSVTWAQLVFNAKAL